MSTGKPCTTAYLPLPRAIVIVRLMPSFGNIWVKDRECCFLLINDTNTFRAGFLFPSGTGWTSPAFCCGKTFWKSHT